jgi:hypothetical protein
VCDCRLIPKPLQCFPFIKPITPPQGLSIIIGCLLTWLDVAACSADDPPTHICSAHLLCLKQYVCPAAFCSPYALVLFIHTRFSEVPRTCKTLHAAMAVLLPVPELMGSLTRMAPQTRPMISLCLFTPFSLFLSPHVIHGFC